MNAAADALFDSINHSHRGTRITAWAVLFCASVLFFLVTR